VSVGSPQRTPAIGSGPRSWLANDGLWALGIFLACLALYGPTLSPSVVPADNGELQMVAHVLGVSHRTGYPLFLLLGWIVTHLPLGSDVAFRLTLFSLFNAAAAMALFYLLLRELDVRRAVAVLSTFLLASAPRLWMHATAAEVYSLSVLFLVLGSWLLLRWGKGKLPLWGVTLAFGFALTHHISIRLVGPAVLVYLLLVQPRLPLRPRVWLPALATLLLPLALYAYVPLRAAHFQALPSLQGDILDVPKVVASGYVSPWYVSAGPVEYFFVTGYSGNVLSRAGLSPEVLGYYLDMLQHQVPWLVVLPLALLGLGNLLLRRTRVALYFLLAYLVTTWAALRFLDQVGGGGNQLLPNFVITLVWFALGAEVLLCWLDRRLQARGWLRILPVLLLACVPLANVVAHYPEALDRRQIETRAQAQAILDQPLPEGAVLAGPWSEITPLRYLQRVEGVRPDLWIIHADEEGIRRTLLPEAQAQRSPFYALRSTQAGARLLPLVLRSEAPIAHTADLSLGEVVRWRGYDLPAGPLAPGAAVPITLYWQAQAPIDRDWTTFIHLLDEQGEKVAQVDRVPGVGLYPPVDWEPGRLVADQYELLLPADLPAGRYTLVFGWYRGQERLLWEDGQGFQRLAVLEVAR
jgi:hypothetical protein